MTPSLSSRPGALDDLVAAHPLPTWKPAGRAIAALLAGFLAWSAYARLDEVAVAPGQVVPAGNVKTIQHLEGGIVSEIFIREGAAVKAGDRLLQLTLAPGGLNREELQARLDGLVLTRERLAAEVENRPLALPADETARQPGLARTERSAFDSRRSERQALDVLLIQQTRQRRAEVEENAARRAAATAGLKLARKKEGMSSQLVGKGHISLIEHLRRQGEVESLRGELATLQAALPRAQAAQAEAEQRLREDRLKSQREIREGLSQTDKEILRTRELLNEASGQRARALVRSPIDGIVKNLRAHTLGGVVRSGEPILEIVPARDFLLVEARLSPADRGYVHDGQRATVKVSTYDYARYGALEGTVIMVAADSTADAADKPPYFRVQVKMDKAWLGEAPGLYPVTSGMQATVDIHTGERSVLDYLVRPVLKLRHEAFRER